MPHIQTSVTCELWTTWDIRQYENDNVLKAKTKKKKTFADKIIDENIKKKMCRRDARERFVLSFVVLIIGTEVNIICSVTGSN